MDKRLVLIAIIGLFLLVTADAGKTKRLRNLRCYPRPAVVQTNPTFYPYFVSLHRCNGSRGTHPPSKFKCVPSKTKDVRVDGFNFHSTHSLILKNHTECRTECTISRDNCKYPMVYDPVNCSCKCNHRSPPSGMKQCKAKQSWNSSTCKCVCQERIRCSRKYEFDEETCSCKCKQRRKQICDLINGIFDAETCKCKKTQIQLSLGESSSGSFVGSTAFWVYILIGEFVLLLACFDAILYCKQMGAMYRITQSCKTKSASVSEEENEANIQTQTLKAHYNDMCDSAFSSLQEISRTNSPLVASKIGRL